MSSTFSNIDIDSSFAKILNVFILLIICSTKILTLAVALVLLTSAGVIWEAPRLLGGTIKVIFYPADSSNKLKPLSTIIEQNGGIKPESFVKALSDIRPV